MSNKSRIPSPARSQGAITPRRYRPRSSRSVGSPACSNTSTRLTSIIQNVFEASPITRRSVLNDDSDIIAPSRRSWWKNLGENSKEVLDVLQSKDIIECNNIIDEFDMEVLSQEKKNYTIDMQDSSDEESIRSIIIPHHKLFAEKENAARMEYNNIIKNRETLNKSRAQKSSVEAYKDISIEPKNLFSQREKRSKPVFPAALLSVSANKTAAEKSIAQVEPKNQNRNLFGNRPATKRKNMFIDFIVSDSDDEIPDIQPKVFTLKRPSLSNRRNSAVSNINSPAQSITDTEMDDWKLLPSSTMVEHQFEDQTTPKRLRHSKVLDDSETNNKSRTDALRKQRDIDLDKLLDIGEDDVNLKGPMDKKSSIYFPSNKQDSLISKSISDTSNTTKSKNKCNKSIHRTQYITADDKNNSKSNTHNVSKITCNTINEILEQNQDNAPNIDEQLSEDDLENNRLLYEEDDDRRSDNSNKKSEAHTNDNNKTMSMIQETNKSQTQDDKHIEGEKSNTTMEKEKELDCKNNDHTPKDVSSENNDNTIIEQHDEVSHHNENMPDSDQEEDFVDQGENNQQNKSEEQNIEEEESAVQQEDTAEEQEESEVENEEIEVEEESELEQEQSLVEQEESEAEQEESAEEQEESEAEPQISLIEQEEDKSEVEQENDNIETDSPNNQSGDVENNILTNNQHQVDECNDSEGMNENSHDNDRISAISNSPHEDKANKVIKNDNNIKSPEAILKKNSSQSESFYMKGRNTSVRKTKSVILKNLDIRPSLAPVRESIEFSDGNRDSSANNSGWDSHRTTRKTMRQTFGKNFTPRKSLRTLVMEKSAKRQTNLHDNEEISKMPQANSTEYPQFESMADQIDDDVDDHIADQMELDESAQELDHEVSKRTRQTTLEMYLQKIKTDNIERKRKMEEDIRNSLKTSSQKFNNLFKVPQRPAIRRVIKTNSSNKTKTKTNKYLIPLDILPEEVLEDLKYKPPKRYQPKNASWVTKRLYKFLETKLEPQYDYKARVRAEKLVEVIFNFTRDIRRYEVAPEQTVDSLKHEMARLHIVNTHFEFYEFFKNYMPRDVRNRVVPDIFNKISLPKPNVFAPIKI